MDRETFHSTRLPRAPLNIAKGQPWINVDQKLQADFLGNQVLEPLKYEKMFTKKLLKCFIYDQAVSKKCYVFQQTK